MEFLYQRIKIYILIPVLLTGLFCSHSISEKEPENNTRKLALKLEPKQILTGTFYSPSGIDIDYIYLTVDDSAMIKGQLSAVKGVDSEILFFNKGELAPFKTVNDNKSSLNENFGPYLISSPGVVIAIRPLQSLNEEKYSKLKYEFSYELTSAPLPMEKESNETIEQANKIENGLIRGYYNNALNGNDIEKDFFSINIPEKQKYRLSANLSKVTGIDGVLRLFSKDGEKLLTVDNGATGEDENIYSYGVQGPTDLYFSVNSKDYKTSSSEYYELKVEVNPYEEKYELEPNNTIRTATPIKVSKIFGDFANDQDVDYYRFYNETFDTVSFFAEVVPGSNYDIGIELYNGINMSPIVYDDGLDEMSEGIASLIIKPLDTIYLKVYKKTIGKTGAYTLNTLISVPSESQERELNNSIKSASNLEPSKGITGYINPGKDLDYYKIKIPVQGKYNIELESPENCTIAISILDVKGIKTEGKNAGKPGENISFQAILDPDSYILVQCNNADKPLYKNPYQLRIFENEQ
ncbi:MAG: hypothetical protein OEV78_11870 [Spirochaetia bacterium]|nr:hypothetical protein [Spirochaetia bacterium]